MSAVKLILRESVHSLGEVGDLVSVKPGYARNFLLPTGKAILATEGRVKELEHHRRIVAEKAAGDRKDLETLKQQLENTRVELAMRAGDGGRLFGSVTTTQIAALLAEKGFEIDRRRISLREPIKSVGEHGVPVKLHREIEASICVVVVAEDAPQEAAVDEPEIEREEDLEDSSEA